MNPFETALENTAVNKVLSTLEPPDNIRMAIENFNRRMNDPAALPEWIAIYKKGGIQGVTNYMEELTELSEAWDNG